MNFFPRKLYQFTPIEAAVPRTVDTNADDRATITLFRSERQRSPEPVTSCLYQISDGRVNSALYHTLKEYIIITKSGMKRNSSVR